MSDTLFFDGRLRKKSLPLFQGPPPPDATGPKRLLLGQGELANFYDGPEGIRYMAFLELRVGGVRGNHVHRVKVEHVYLFSGEMQLLAKDDQGGELVAIDLRAGDLITIEPGIAHAMKPVAAGYAVEFSPTRFDAGDIEKRSLV